MPVLGVDSAPDNLSSPKPWTCGVYSENIENRAAHNLAAIPVFAGLPAAAASYGWRSRRAGQPPGFAIYCAATAVTMPVTRALAGAGFSQSSPLGGYGGLFHRASIITGFAWLTAVSARVLQRTLPGTAGTS